MMGVFSNLPTQKYRSMEHHQSSNCPSFPAIESAPSFNPEKANNRTNQPSSPSIHEETQAQNQPMAYRRRHGPNRSLTFPEDFPPPQPPPSYSSNAFAVDGSPSPSVSSSLPSPVLAAQAIMDSAAHRDSSVSHAYGYNAHYNPKNVRQQSSAASPHAVPTGTANYEYTSMRGLNDSKFSFWEDLARKAKSILEDGIASQQFENYGGSQLQIYDTSPGSQFDDHYPYNKRRTVNKGSEFASSLHQIGGTIRNAFEEGLTMVEHTTADIIQETRKLQIIRKPTTDLSAPNYAHPNINDLEAQLKSSHDVSRAMAAKAKHLLRELKTVKAELVFSKERCSQLEDQIKFLRENREKGDNLEDDDLIRCQLETLLEEKGRLAHENSVFARENRFLREIVDYHQLTMQDVIYVDESVEEVTEVCPIHMPPHLSRNASGASGHSSEVISTLSSSNPSNQTSPRSLTGEDTDDAFLTAVSTTPMTPSSPAVFSSNSKEESPADSPTHES